MSDNASNHCPHCGESLSTPEVVWQHCDGPSFSQFRIRRYMDGRVWVEWWRNGQRITSEPMSDHGLALLRQIVS